MILFLLCVLLVLFLTGVLFFYISFKNTYKIQVNRVEIPLKMPLNQPLHILHLSDMHIEKLSISPVHLFETIKDMPIDLIAITGDLLEKKNSIQPFMNYIEQLQKISAPLGIYVVFGNHDYLLRQDIQEFRTCLEGKGCIVLQNESRTIQHGTSAISIIGVDNYSTRRSNLAKAFHGVENGHALVLTHDPNVILEMDSYPFSYLLAGHFHGGQIHWPKPFHMVKYGPIARMKMIRGLHYYKGKPIYISEGLGQTALKLRWGTLPEVTLHKLL
jgi:predicted MPP superfamily phosphohydrolase